MKMKHNRPIYVGCSYRVLRGKLIVLNACIRNEEKSQINNVNSYLKNQKKKWNKLKESKRNERIKIKVEFNKIKNRKRIEN